MAASVGDRLVQAIACQDAQALAECFTPEAEFRALVPPGLRERQGGAETAALISAWFGDSTELELVESTVVEVADRLHVTYSFRGVENGEPYLVEQHLFCTLAQDRIARADLLCSGFRPR